MGDCIYINSEKPELTKEEMEVLGIRPIREPFKRIPGQIYYCIGVDGISWPREDEGSLIDEGRYSVANYCADKKIMRQRAMYETLSRLLWRFSEQNGGKGMFGIANKGNGSFCSMIENYRYLEPTFKTANIADRAIVEIVKPFMKAHPDFVW